MTPMRTDKDFLFVVGCPRSGTYLLAAILTHHFSVAIPLETHFIPLFSRFLYLWGDLSNYDNRKRLLHCIFEFLEIWTSVEVTDMNFTKEKEHEFSLLAIKDQEKEILEESESYPEIVCSLFRAFAKKRGANCWGDKSSFATHISLERLEKAVHQSKIIHIIRDGRDVSLSWRRIWTGPKTLIATALAWSRHVQEKRKWGAANCTRYLEIRYEDLLEGSEAVIARIGKFLGLPVLNPNTSFVESEFAKALGSGQTHPLLSQHIIPQNKEKWKSNMPEFDRCIFESLAGSTLKECGYDVSEKPRGLRRRMLLAACCIAGVIRECFSVRQFKYIVKNMLPLIIFIMDFFHIRPSTFLSNH